MSSARVARHGSGISSREVMLVSPAQISPELRQWVLGCVHGYLAPEAIVALLQCQSWDAGAARRIVARVLADRRFVVPTPALTGLERRMVEGRTIAVRSATPDRTLVHFGGFLSRAECSGLMKEASDHLVAATTTVAGQLQVHAGRSADSHFFPLGASPLVRRVEKRVEALFDWDIADTEGIQIQRYGQGGRYQPHYDYFDGVAPPLRGEGPSRQRVATLLVYLAMPAKGGATHFVERELRFSPAPGDALFFSYDHPSPQTRTLHEGCPVEAGEKWVVNVWFRERV